MINITKLLTDDTNIIEIYICPKQNDNPNFIDIALDENKINKIKEKYSSFRTTKYNIFYRNHLSYIYDDSNDNQIVSMKSTKNSLFIKTKGSFNDLYAISYKEDKLPIHYFPCTNDIDYFSTIIINEVKINNRITLVIKNDNNIMSSYIQYRHGDNVDIEKIKDCISMVCKTISSFT